MITRWGKIKPRSSFFSNSSDLFCPNLRNLGNQQQQKKLNYKSQLTFPSQWGCYALKFLKQTHFIFPEVIFHNSWKWVDYHKNFPLFLSRWGWNGFLRDHILFFFSLLIVRTDVNTKTRKKQSTPFKEEQKQTFLHRTCVHCGRKRKLKLNASLGERANG